MAILKMIFRGALTQCFVILNKTSNVRINVELRSVHVTFVAIEKQ
jgi:hypothetical protein